MREPGQGHPWDVEPARAGAASARAERDLLRAVLETLSASRHMAEYLDRLVEHVQDYSGCRCVGIRLLDKDGNIPYVAYTGFTQEFYESESPLCIRTDQCMCTRVIRGDTRPGLPFYTGGGSFLSNSATDLLASTPPEIIGPYRGVCHQAGFESLALVPMKRRGAVLGLIHVADREANRLPQHKVRFLEEVGAYIGEALHTFMAEQERDRLLEQVAQERERIDHLARALKKERDTLEVIMENTGAHLAYLDRDFNFIAVNGTYARGSGHAMEELIGRNHFDLFPNEENQAIFERVRDTGQPAEYHDKPFEFPDQPWRGVTYWDWTLTPILDGSGEVQGLVLSLVDTTERKKAEQALRESEARYRALFEQAGDSIVLADAQTGEIVEFNDRACQDLGYSHDEFSKLRMSDLEADDDAEEARKRIARVIKEGSDVFDARHRARNGDIRDVFVSARAIRLGGRELILSIWRDITERRKLDELKDEFIGLVSHELRSPLTVIMGAVNTALTEADRLSPGEMRQLLQDASSETEVLSHLLGNLLELARAQADRLLLHVEPVSVVDVVSDTVSRLKRQAATHRFIIDIPAELPHVLADPLRLDRILYNLLQNAAKYSPAGSEVSVSARADGENVLLAVADQGPGLSPADQARLFGPFQRLESTRRSDVGGVGLGLLVCRRLVEVHGGRIWVESEPGHGCTFFFTLPRARHRQH